MINTNEIEEIDQNSYIRRYHYARLRFAIRLLRARQVRDCALYLQNLDKAILKLAQLDNATA